jgi:transposase
MATTTTKHRGDLSDAQWALIAPLLPRQRRGGKWNDHRTTFNGILWMLRTGAPWRDLPERYGRWSSVHHRFGRWRSDGTFERVLKALRIRLDKDGLIDWDLWCVWPAPVFCTSRYESRGSSVAMHAGRAGGRGVAPTGGAASVAAKAAGGTYPRLLCGRRWL